MHSAEKEGPTCEFQWDIVLDGVENPDAYGKGVFEGVDQTPSQNTKLQIAATSARTRGRFRELLWFFLVFL